jgi:undecaprenyl-diphosphatase
MKRQRGQKLRVATGLFVAFTLWTAAVRLIDVQPIGPNGSVVGFSAWNAAVHDWIGVHWTLYMITDWLGLVPVCFMLGFAILGLIQWVQRKRIFSVDRDIIALGGFYLIVTAVYLFFEQFVVNYRPVLVNGLLEASYPSSTTLLVLTVMPTAMMQLYSRIRNPVFRRGAMLTISVLIAFMIIARFFSGVHWMTDIVGGILLSGSLVMLYAFVIGSEEGNHTDES